MQIKVCHLTSAHPRNDIRIFVKECRSLSKEGYDVSLVVADGKGDEIVEDIKIIDVGKGNGRFSRMTRTAEKVCRKAMALDADIYHFHDPELMRFALRLQKQGKKVIYDVHEDLPRQLFGKAYLGKFSASVISFIAEKVENFYAKKFSGIVTVTPLIRDRFKKLNDNVAMVCNFPLLEEFSTETAPVKKENEICYIGSITEERGIIEMLKAIEKIDTRLNLAGAFGTEELSKRARNMQGWKKVNEAGLLNRDGVVKVLSRSKVGLSVLRELPNYVSSYPIKIFEYMAAGIPVVASDFPLWKEIVEGNNCGICVDPKDTDAIAAAVNSLLQDDARSQQLGVNGKKAVKEKYNWEAESRNLVSFYKKLV